MADPNNSSFNFFVFVIESPSSADLYHKRFEGEILTKAINLNNIPCAHRVAISLEAFKAALHIGLPEVGQIYPNLIPIIHISAHGDQNGIQLSDGSILDWDQLKVLIQPINKALNNNLILCMSSCEGYSACRMAMTFSPDDSPFFAMIGNTKQPNWSDTAIGFATFYHLICKGHFIIDATKAMCVASGNPNFQVITAQDAKKTYLDQIVKSLASYNPGTALKPISQTPSLASLFQKYKV